MPAVKSGNDIHVSGSGNTLTTIVSDIADTAFIDEISAGVFEIDCTSLARELKILDGGVLTIGNKTTYSTAETLQWNATAHSRAKFRINSNGHLNMYGNTVLDFSFNSAYYSYYIYIFGGLTIKGDVTHKPIIKNMRNLDFRNETSNDRTIDVSDCIFGSSSYTSSWDAFCLKFSGPAVYAKSGFTFLRVAFDQTYGQNRNTTAVNFEYGYRGMENYIFEECSFTNIYRAFDSECGYGYTKNCTFDNLVNHSLIATRSAPNFGDQPYGAYSHGIEKLFGQTYSICDGNTFENTGYNGKLYAYYGARILVRGTHIKELSSNSIYATWGGMIMWWTGNTQDNTTTALEIYSGGMINQVNGFTWTVEDSAGLPLEGVSIRVVQNEGKERFLFETGPDGKPYDFLGEGVVLLTHTHQWGGNYLNSPGYFVSWSDTANSTYHTVEFSKPGYRTVTRTYNVKQDGETTETITLRRADAHALTF